MSVSTISDLTPPPPETPQKRHSKRNRGQQPDITDPSIIENVHKKLKKTAGSSTAGTRKTAKKAPAVPLTQLPLAIPEQNAHIPSPYSSTVPKARFMEFFGEMTRSGFVRRALVFQWNMDPPAKAGFDKGQAFARWVRTPVKSDEQGLEERGLLCTRPVVEETWIGKHGQISWDDQVSTAKQGKRGKAYPLRVRRAMEIFQRDRDGEAVYFLWWERVQDVKVNGRRYEVEGAADFAIGPLPNFAVIEVEATVIFWWKNQHALGHVPEELYASIRNQQEKEAQEKQQQAAAKSQEHVARARQEREEEARKVNYWRKMFNSGMRRHVQFQRSDPKWSSYLVWRNLDSQDERKKEDPYFHQIEKPADLWFNDVVLAIGTVWQAVKAMNRRFAFHNEVGFNLPRGIMIDRTGFRVPMQAAVNGPKDLIIPMNFNEYYVSPPNSATYDPAQDPTASQPAPQEPDSNNNGETQGRAGHILLVVAHQNADGTINMTRMDSCPGHVEADRIRRSTRRLVRKIGWLHMDNQGNMVEPEFDPDVVEQEEVAVPQQISEQSCGIHTILNAWGYMLGLPLLNDTVRIHYPECGPVDEARFILRAMVMINHALTGNMSLRTIQAFFNFNGYCKLQDPDESEVLMPDIATPRITENILDSLLQDDRDIQMTSAPAPDPRRYPVAAIAGVMEAVPDCSRIYALSLLEATGGDINLAVGLVNNQD
ncbi:MAG: hypothetical protein Q9201_006526 [Fulgogasparrea decipioides]